MVKIVYWTGTGNTGNMAKYIAEGIEKSNKTVEKKEVGNISIEEALKADLLVLGCPSMGSEELEESEMEPFVEALEGKIKGHKIALFGSYGWGDGEWMREWEGRMMAAGANILSEPLIVNEFTIGEDEEKCTAFGKLITQV